MKNLYVNQIEDAICDEKFLKKLSKLKSISEIKEAFFKDKNIEVDRREIEELYKTIFEFEIMDSKNKIMKMSEYLTDVNKINKRDDYQTTISGENDENLKEISGGLDTSTSPTTTRSSKWGLNTISKIRKAIQTNVSETNF